MKKSKFYKITHLETDLWAIEDRASSENSICYLILGTDKALLFDTGLGLDPLLPYIRKITALPILACLSHWHFDHSGGAFEFQQVIGWRSKKMEYACNHGIGDSVIKLQVDQPFWHSIASDTLKIKNFRILN